MGDIRVSAPPKTALRIPALQVNSLTYPSKFLLYAPSTSAGLSIPYPSISLHAIQRLRVPGSETEVQGLYMQIATPTPSADDDEEECITLTVVPPSEPGVVGGNTATAEAATSTAAERATQDLSEAPTESPMQMLYGAVSACSNLHPDPAESDEEEEGGKFFGADGIMAGTSDGGLPEPVEGSSGWITAENVGDFMDENGEYVGPGCGVEVPWTEDAELGPGAGNVHGREENGDGAEGEDESDETKWRRTD